MGNGAGVGGDWAAQTADRITQVVDSVRSKTTEPLTSIVRWVVFGLLAGIVGLVALVLFVVMAVRALDELLPQEVWLPYLVLGAIFVVAGLLLWSKKTAKPADDDKN